MSLIGAWILAMTAGLAGADGEARDSLLIIRGNVLAPDGASWLTDHAVLVVDGRIEEVLPTPERTSREGTRVLDVGGSYVTPGLIDLHTHLLLHPYDEASWETQVLKESLELRTIRAVPAARATLEAGFTTIRELGTEGAGFADVALRDAIDQGIIPGPRILTTTRALVTTGGYGPFGFDPRFDVPKGAQTADGVDGVRVAVREQIAAGADWIKVYADYRRRPGAPSTPTFSADELEAIVDEAHSAGVPVAAHASTDAAIRRAVEAGVHTIEHGYEASDATLELMADNNVVLCPTLAASEAVARYSGWSPPEPEPPRVQRARSLIQRALKVRVMLACGSDAGVFAHGDNARELELMVEYGMTPAAALDSATAMAAIVLGRDDLGRIRPGATADLVVFRGNPLETIGALRHPVVVVKEGRVVLFEER